MGNNKSQLVMALVIFIIALIIRLWGIDNGLPHVQRPDETGDITQSLQFVRGDTPNYAYHRVAWPLFQLPLHGGHFVWRYLTTPNFSISDFEALYYTQRHTFLLSTRIYLAIITALSCVVGFFALRRFAPVSVALVGGLLLAIYPPYVYLSHIALPDAFATAGVVFCFFGISYMINGRHRWAYVLAGGAAALVMLTRLQAITLVVLPVAMAHLVVWWQMPQRSWRFLLTYWLWALLGFMVAHVVFNPFIVLNPNAVLADLSFIFNERYTGANHIDISAFDPLRNVGLNFDLPIVFLRPYLLSVFALATLHGLIKKQWTIVVMALGGWLFIASLLPTTTPRITFWLQASVPIALTVGWSLGELLRVTRHRQMRLTFSATVVATSIVFGWALVDSVLINRALANTDTQSLAHEYITQTIPADARIMLGDTFIYTVPLQRNLDSMNRLDAMGRATASHEFFLGNPHLLDDVVYDIYGAEHVREIQSDEAMLNFMRENAIAYVVGVEYCQGEISYAWTSALTFPKITSATQEYLALMAVFSPFEDDTCRQPIENRTHMEFMRLMDWERVGPILRVYEVLLEDD